MKINFEELNLISPQVPIDLLKEIDWDKIVARIHDKLFLKELQKETQFPAPLNWDDSKSLFEQVKVQRSISSQCESILKTTASTDLIILKRYLTTRKYPELPDLDEVSSLVKWLDDVMRSDFIHYGLYEKFRSLVLDEMRAFRDFFLPTTVNGKFLFHKIPGLASAKKQLESIYFQMVQILENNIVPLYENALQNKTLIFRDGCFTIAIFADQYQKDNGRIVAQSNSGRTFYVEPKPLLKLNSDYNEILIEFDTVIAQFKFETLGLLNKASENISQLLNLLCEIDFNHAKDNFYEGNKCIPTFSDVTFSVSSAYHPLIERPVPNDINFDSNVLLLTGANSSGKTVYMKIMALMIVLSRHGIPVPAKKATIPQIDSLLYPSASHQQILNGTSSFVAEFDALSYLYSAPKKSIVIWDEAFGNTSSRDATALILSIVEAFQSMDDVRFLISTHHEQLKTLSKSMKYINQISTDPDFRYQIIKNFTSPSNPLESIERKRKDSALLSQIRKRYIELTNLNRDFLEDFYKDLIDKEKSQLETIKKLTLEIDNIRNEIKMSEISLQDKQKLNSKVNQLEEQKIAVVPMKILDSENSPKPAPEIDFNSFYTSRTLSAQVKVISKHKKGYECLVKGKRIVLPGDDLIDKRGMPIEVVINIEHTNNETFRFDLRGLRRDEFINEAERAIGLVLTGSNSFIEIIHGKGNGILLEAIRELSRRYKDLKFEFSDDLGSVKVS